MRRFLEWAIVFLVFSVLLLILMEWSGSQAVEKALDLPQKTGLSEHYSEALEMGYYMYVPEGYKEVQRYPLILYLHGSNAKGNGKNELMKVMNHGLKALLYTAKGKGCLILAPQANPQWVDGQLDALLDNITSQYAVDPNRIYLTGVSMGGMGTWSYAVNGKYRLAAIVPICGYYYYAENVVNKVKDLPTWLFHGDKDLSVPVERAYAAIHTLEKVNGAFKYTILENKGHDIWNDVYMNEALYDWLLDQSLN